MDTKLSRNYKHLPPLIVDGFVVKVISVFNLDIDLEIPEEYRHLYSGAVSSSYCCLTQGGGYSTKRLFRCHLKGITYSESRAKSKIRNEEEIFVNNYIDHGDGWVKVEISDIDSYGRILVRLFNDSDIQKSLNDILKEKFDFIIDYKPGTFQTLSPTRQLYCYN